MTERIAIKCFRWIISRNYLKVSKYRIQKSLQKLLNLGLIKHAGTKKGKRGRSKNVYEIVDIWELNVNYYDNHKNNGKITPVQPSCITDYIEPCYSFSISS